MKTGINKAISVLGMLAVLTISSCKERQFIDEPMSSAQVAFNYPNGRLEVDSEDKFTRIGSTVTIPVSISLSSATPTLFSVNLSSKPDTIHQLIAEKKLANTVALPEGTYSFPATQDVRFGAKEFTFNIECSSADIERFYGKKLAIALNIAATSKNTPIEGGKQTVIVVIDTDKIIPASEVHKVFFADYGKLLTLPESSYSEDENYLNIPVDVLVSGLEGPSLSVKLTHNPDTLQKLIDNNTLTNTVALSNDNVLLSATTVGAEQNSAIATIKVPVAEIAKYLGKNVALAVDLSDPTKYQVDENKKTLVVKVDIAKALQNISGLMKNYRQPFRSTNWDLRRWGILDDWTTTNPVTNQEMKENSQGYKVGWYGGYDQRNNTAICMQSGYGPPAAPNITNGKIYQTVNLPAGRYRIRATSIIGSTSTSQHFYVVAAKGLTIPDIANLSTQSIASVRVVRDGGTSDVVHELNFTLAQPEQITIGFVGSLSGSVAFCIRDLKLLHIQ